MKMDLTKITEEIAMRAEENQEEFIFETIYPYCENVLQIKINKEELKQILLNGVQKQKPCDDCISREEAIRVAEQGQIQGYVWEFKKLCTLPSVTPKQTEWIPVSERLPDTDDEVLCWYKYYHWSREKVLPEYGLGRYLQNTQAWYGEVAQGKDVEVIAWMPLPEPYKESEKEVVK